MRLLSRLVIALAVCLIAIALPTLPAQAVCGGPAIQLVPGSGVPGTQLIVQGQHFDAGKYIDIYYAGTLISEGSKTSISGDFSIPFTIPESCKGNHQIIVDVGTDSIGTIELKTSFYATPGLLVSPDEGPEGSTITVTGHGFIKNEDGIELMYYTDEDTYQRVGRGITADANGYWETTFQIPVSGRGEHKIDAQGSFSQTYDVKDAIFQVTAAITMDKSSGGVGESVTMTGSRFGAYEKDIRILFDGQPIVTSIKADSQGDWGKTFDVPGMPTGNHTVTAEGEYTTREDVGGLSFEIKPDIVLSPTTGHVGTNVTITGCGFVGDKDVSIMYDGGRETTATTDDEGNFEASFPVPPSQHGEHQVTIGYSAGNIAGATFTLESVSPDAPQLISPAAGGRVGLIGRRVKPTFEWSAVSDDSGVHYSLQIATSDDFAASSIIASVTGLTGTSYTFDKALPYGGYYWTVQAVDGAQNGGSWAATGSFRVGLLPLWAFITIIVAVAVMVIVLIRALLRRRRYYW
jgi:hypothetical protein